MKRLFLVFTILLCVCLLGCGGQRYNILDYQDKNINAECVVNDKYKINLIKSKDKAVIEVQEPKEAQGISFIIEENTSYAVSGDVKIQMEKKDLGGICAIGSMFSQNEECLVRATEQGKGSVFIFQNDSCMYQITLGENSVPHHVKITSESFEYDIEICSIELN